MTNINDSDSTPLTGSVLFQSHAQSNIAPSYSYSERPSQVFVQFFMIFFPLVSPLDGLPTLNVGVQTAQAGRSLFYLLSLSLSG